MSKLFLLQVSTIKGTVISKNDKICGSKDEHTGMNPKCSHQCIVMLSLEILKV